jgi:hypothetical protein
LTVARDGSVRDARIVDKTRAIDTRDILKQSAIRCSAEVRRWTGGRGDWDHVSRSFGRASRGRSHRSKGQLSHALRLRPRLVREESRMQHNRPTTRLAGAIAIALASGNASAADL